MPRTQANVSLGFAVESRIPQVVGVLQSQINRKVYAMGTVVRTKLLTEVLVGERHGRWYVLPGNVAKNKARGKKGAGPKMYRASRPGEAPATRLGDLRRSYRVGKVEGTALDTHVKVGSPLDYAVFLEQGTKHVIERLHLSTALELAKPDIEAILRGDWGI